MADTWGTVTINVMSVERPPAEMYFTEHKIVPDPTLPSTTRQSVYQGSGRMGKRVRITGHGIKTVVDALEVDMYAMTSRILTMDDGFTMTAYIQPNSLNRHRELGTTEVFYDCIFMEA